MKVLVTGAGGHLGAAVVAAFALAGHSVRASLRTLDDRKAIARATAAGADDVVALDIRDPAAFGKAVTGIDMLVHVAATYRLVSRGTADAEAIVADSVEGVETALRAAAEAGIGKVVLTSSIVTLPMSRADGPRRSEADWREDLAVPYFRAKTLAEKRAWELAGALGLDLVTLLPGAIGGPGFVRPTPTIDTIAGIMKGMMRLGVPRTNLPYVDVRDAAGAHLLAATGKSSGRYILCDEPIPTLRQISEVMHRIDPKVPAAPRTLPPAVGPFLPLVDAMLALLQRRPRTLTPALARSMNGTFYKISSRRIRDELGWRPRYGLEDSLRDTMAAIAAAQ